MPINLQSALLFVGKSVVFAAILWCVTQFLHTLNRPQGDSSDGAAHAAQVAVYNEQMQRQKRMLDESEQLQQRMAAQIRQQEEQAARMDKVLQAWERQAGIGK
ncbi:hypothetical protein [Massilia sp. YIM B02443]|uniref:hypothetical protein n=1 Tax=Massilia sp. YIM B02443 TaxID=3050127 RepID=UPI0025B6893B|nr:hypothetical protein [Massilia sp. YIM B02443]MDN4036227.1 hypothetical protein [Massilia sp. YIM B02443]